jgi:hypothetical protein
VDLLGIFHPEPKRREASAKRSLRPFRLAHFAARKCPHPCEQPALPAPDREYAAASLHESEGDLDLGEGGTRPLRREVLDAAVCPRAALG